MMILANIAGLLLIGLIIWWFWLYKPKEVSVDGDELLITVDNGVYAPAHIKLAKRRPAKLTFLRKDASPCAEILMIPELDVNESLPLNKPVSVTIPALDEGEYAFHCQMQMYRGRITIG